MKILGISKDGDLIHTSIIDEKGNVLNQSTIDDETKLQDIIKTESLDLLGQDRVAIPIELQITDLNQYHPILVKEEDAIANNHATMDNSQVTFPVLSIQDVTPFKAFIVKPGNIKRLNPNSTTSINDIYVTAESILETANLSNAIQTGDIYAYNFSLSEDISPKGNITYQSLLEELKTLLKDELKKINANQTTTKIVAELIKNLKEDLAASFALALYNSITSQIIGLADSHDCKTISLFGNITHQATFNNILDKIAKDFEINLIYPENKDVSAGVAKIALDNIEYHN